MITYLKGLGPERWLTHLCLLAVSIAACVAATYYRPGDTLVMLLTIGLGYAALFFLVVTLLIGPAKLLGQRRNPVNSNLRRDFGIWTGITGLLHVFFGFQVHMRGDIVMYFFDRNPHHPDQLTLLTNLFGLSNDLGLIGTLIVAMLLILSNDISLRALKGPGWKFLQRANYFLLPVAVGHTLGWQFMSRREPALILAVVAGALITLLAQFSGFVMMVSRMRQVRAERS